jgi:hypothetical protein
MIILKEEKQDFFAGTNASYVEHIDNVELYEGERKHNQVGNENLNLFFNHKGKKSHAKSALKCLKKLHNTVF